MVFLPFDKIGWFLAGILEALLDSTKFDQFSIFLVKLNVVPLQALILELKGIDCTPLT